VNKLRTFERRNSRLAFALSCLLHIAAGTLIFFVVRNFAVEQWPSMGPGAANSNIMQIELRPAASASAQPVLLPPSKPAEVPLEEIKKPPEPVVTKPAEASESRVSAESQTAQMAQSASAPGAQVEADEPLAGKGRAGEINWRMLAVAKVRAMIEHEKHYPPSAQKAGYTGRFLALIRLEPGGTVSGYEIKERRGHPLLGKAVEATLEKIKGRTIGMTLPEQFEFTLPIEFELN
jgi:TonB family protein